VLSPLTRFEGVEFVLAVPPDEKTACDAWGLEDPPQLANWARSTFRRLSELGEKLDTGALGQINGFGLQRHWALARDVRKGLLCVGFRRTLTPEKVDETMKHVFTKWAS
jgi:hypothetical protein